MAEPTPENTKNDAEAIALLPQFVFEKLLNQDQGGRRISLLGTIQSQPALLSFERAAFATSSSQLRSLASHLSRIQNLGANDIYHWFLASSSPSSPSSGEGEGEDQQQPPDLKINLIWPCTAQHVQKYSAQGVRVVHETPELYAKYVRPYAQKKRDEGRLNWVFNILEGRKEQENILYRDDGAEGAEEGFLLLPDLNWDRATLPSLHLLALPLRRDLWSLRDLHRSHIPWLRSMRAKLLTATTKLYPSVEADQLKFYFHYQPTYYHLHIHIVHAAYDAGMTQATGKALGLEHVIAQLETLDRSSLGADPGMADVALTYTLGERNELWEKIFRPLKEGREVVAE